MSPAAPAAPAAPAGGISQQGSGAFSDWGSLLGPLLPSLRAPGCAASAPSKISGLLGSAPSLAAFAGGNPAFLPLLAAVCTGPLETPKDGAVVPSHPDPGVKFPQLTAPQGAALGASLSPLLASKPAGEAVGEWIGSFPALKALDKEEAWFRMLMKGVGKEVQDIEKNMLVVWFVTCKKAFLSVLDMVTDAAMIVEYGGTPGKEKYARALLAMCGLCLLFQLFCVWVQNHRGPPLNLCKEVFFAVACLKPGVDAFRVANSEEQAPYAVAPPHAEMVMTKCFEMAFESIPGCVLQMYVILGALLEGRGVSTQALLSVAASALSTGYSSATITHDFDTTAWRRRDSPEFYGFVPAGAAGAAVFACMLLNSALLLLARGASAALLMHAGAGYALLYVLGDVALFFLQKAARGDFRTFHNKDGWAGFFFFDVLWQLIMKLIVDYTGLIQFRGPGVLGGCYWTANMLLALAAPFGAVAVFFASDASVDSALDESFAWILASSMCGAWILLFLVFLLLMNPAHRRTFYSTLTIRDWVCSFFTKEGATDRSRVMIFEFRRRLWQHIREEVREWMLANWGRFEQEQPDWLTPARVAQVDDDMIPAESIEGQRRAVL